MTESISDPRDELLAQAANEYFEATGRGEHPSIEEFARKYASIAVEVRQLFPALALVGDSTAGGVMAAPLAEGAGRQQLGDFRIEREIGRGGMGIVYEAEQLSLGRRVALKVLPFAAVMDEKAIARFKNEARAAATLEHPNIVPVFAVGNERGVYFYAMAFIEGRSLAEVIHAMQKSESGAWHHVRATAANGSAACAAPSSVLDSGLAAAPSTLPAASPRETYRSAARLGLQAAEALQHAHERGIVHRDIKPANLMIDAAGKLWVTDFGLARIGTDAGMTMTGDLLGTIRYMAPEQTLGQRAVVDQRADVYSLGATLYELLALQPAFVGADRQALLKQIALEEPKPLRHVAPSIPRDLETIVLKATAKEPTDRYHTARDFAEDLKRFLEDQPIAARPPSSLQKVARWGRRHSGAVMIACFALVALSLVLAVSTVLVDRARSVATNALASSQQHQSELANLLYAADIRLADQALRHDDIGRALELLDGHIPARGAEDLRDLEWHFLRARCLQNQEAIATSGDAIYSFAFSPDGTQLATVGKDAILRVYDWPAGSLAKETATNQTEINGIAFGRDGQWLATSGDDGTIQIRDRSSHRLTKQIQTSADKVFDAAYLNSSRLLVTSGHDDWIRLWDPSDWSLAARLEGHEDTVSALAISPQEDRLATSSRDRTVRVWSLPDGREIQRWQLRSRPSVVAFSSDGEIVIVGDASGNVHRYRIEDGTAFERTGINHVTALAASSDGQWLLAGDQRGRLWLWKIAAADGRPSESLQRIRSWQGHDGQIYKVAFAPGGRHIVSAGADGKVIRWDPIDVGGPRRTTRLPDLRIYDVAMLAGRSEVAIVAGARRPAQILLLDWNSREITRRLAEDGDDWRIATSPDGKLLAGIDQSNGEVLVWQLDSDDTIQEDKIKVRRHLGYAAFSPDSRHLAVYGASVEDGLVLIDLQSRERKSDFVATGCWSAAFSPDGRLLAAVERTSNDILVWQLDSHQLVRRITGLTDAARRVSFSPDSRLLASLQSDRQVHVWDIDAGVARWSSSTTFTDTAQHRGVFLEFTPRGRSIVTATSAGIVQMWHVETGRELLMLDELQRGELAAAAISDRGEFLCEVKNGALHVIEIGSPEREADMGRDSSPFSPTPHRPQHAPTRN